MSNKIVKFTDLLDCPKTLVSNDIIVVNADGSGLDEVTPSSIIASGVGSGLNGDIATFTGGVPVLQDSGLNLSTSFNTVNIKPASSLNSVRLDSDASVSVGSLSTQSISVNADQSVGYIGISSASQQMIAYNTISISANNGVTIQAGGGAQIQISNTGDVTVSCASGGKLELLSNGGSGRYIMDASTNTAGNIVFPTVPPVGDCVLKCDSVDGLMYWEPVAPPP